MSKLEAYSPYKAVRYLDVIQGIREGRPVRPVHVQIILSDLCNQSCNFCAYRDPGYSSSQMFYEIVTPEKKSALRRDVEHPERNYNPNRMIPYGKVLEILDDCHEMHVEGVQFTGGGEPTVHPKFLETVASAHSYGLSTSLVSNGVNIAKKWTPDHADELSRMAWVRISLDAGQRDTYAWIRNVPGDHFDQATEAIRLLREARDKHKTKLVIGVGFVVTPQNWREVYQAAALVQALGADNIRISAQFSPEDEKLFTPFHEECASLCRQAVYDLDSASFQVYDRFSQKLDDLKLKSPDYERCGFQHFTTYIGADLNVYRCCVQAYNAHGLVGSLKEQRFRELWMTQARADEMATFKAPSCDRCQFNGINRFLDYAIRPIDPDHSEFV